MAEDEQFNQAFGEHTGIDEEVRGYINNIKDNNSDTNELALRSDDTDEFSYLALRLLGRYIANNEHLNRLDVDESRLTDEMMSLLFKELTSSRSLKRLDIDCNEFGIEGVRSMIPLVQNSPNLTTLYMGANTNINTECFDALISALHGRPIEKLYSYQCNITDISALDRYNLPNLQTLNLSSNKIGRDGCITLSNLLQKEGSNLTALILRSVNFGDDEVEIIAASLKHNTKLKELYLPGNNLTNEACVVFLKLLANITSIESTYTSNYTLTTCELNGDFDKAHAKAINDACKENRLISSDPKAAGPHAAGRTKVIKYQLNSLMRKKLCELQGVEYSSIGYIFVDMEVNLLPHILALIGRVHGHSEFYTSLLPVAPDLMSFIDRKAMLNDERDQNTAKIAALAEQLSIIRAKNDQIDIRLALIDSEESKHSEVDGKKECGSGEKRQRIN